MKFNRTRNSIRNIIWGFFNKFVMLFFPFIIRTIIIKKLGVEYLGLNSLFSSILQILSLTELGFSSAIVFSLYQPVSENNTQKISSLMNYFKKVYRIVGTVILVLGLLILPFLNQIINGDYPSNINIYVVYLIQLFNVSITYYLFAYKNVLLIAYQRNDISSKVNGILYIIQYLLQILIIVLLRDYYLFLIIVSVMTIVNNLVINHLVDKRYPYCNSKEELDIESKQQIKKSVKGLLINKICQTTRNSLDSIFLSFFLGLNVVAIYNNYYSILNSIVVLLGIVSTSILSSIGNSIVVHDMEKNYQDMKKFNFIYMLISGWATIFLLCLYQPFMKLWMGEQYLFDFKIVVLFCVYFYCLEIGVIRASYSDATGLWWENRNRAILETICNIVLNILLGKLWGVYGIICGTLFSLLLINFGMGSQILYKHYFKTHKVSEYFKSHFIYAVITIIVASITYVLCSLVELQGILDFMVKGIICTVIPILLYALFYMKTNLFHYFTFYLKKIKLIGWKDN